MAEEKKISKKISVLTTPERNIPKFCTSVNFGVAQNNNIVISFAYNEENGPLTLIDRVMVDFEHAKSIAEVLRRVIDKVEKKEK